jgi:hypothetical protein
VYVTTSSTSAGVQRIAGHVPHRRRRRVALLLLRKIERVKNRRLAGRRILRDVLIELAWFSGGTERLARHRQLPFRPVELAGAYSSRDGFTVQSPITTSLGR